MKTKSHNPTFDIYDDLNDIIYIIDNNLNIIYGNNLFKIHYKIDGSHAINNEKSKTIIDGSLQNSILDYFNSDKNDQLQLSIETLIGRSTFTLKKIQSTTNDILCFVVEKPKNSADITGSAPKFNEEDSIHDLFFRNMTESLVLYKVLTNDNNKAIDFEYITVNQAFENSVGITNNELQGKLLFKDFPQNEDYWREVHVNAYEQQKLFQITAYSSLTNKYWELKAFPAGKGKIASLSTDVTEYILFEKNIKEKNKQISVTEEKLRAYNEHLKYTCELIKESELSYKTLFEQNNDAILILVNGMVKDCNNKALQLLNCQPYDIIGKSFMDLSVTDENNQESSMDQLYDCCHSMKVDEKFTTDWQLVSPTGKTVDTNIIISCYMLEDIKHMYVIIKDLTKEKTFIEEIKENEYLLEEAQRTAKLGHWSFDMLHGDTMIWSNEMKSIIEESESKGFFQFIKTLIHPDDNDKIAPVFEYYTLIPSSFDVQFRIITSTLKTKFIHFEGKIIEKRNKKICRGIIQDITSKYEQDERILFESKINETIANAGADLISPSLSIDNIVRTIFKACVELTRSETGFVAYDDPLSDKILIHFYDDSYINGNKVSNNIYFIERKKYQIEGLYGHPIELSKYIVNNNFNLGPLKKINSTTPEKIKNFLTFPSVINEIFTGQIVLINSPNGFTDQHISAIKTLSNIYGLAVFRKQMEWDLVAAKEKAEESDRLKSAFLANMSHEIRTPMNAIVGFSQLLIHSEVADHKKQEFGQLINNSCSDLLTIVNDIIDISKIEAGQLMIIPKTINLSKVINEIYTLAQNKAQIKDKSYPVILENKIEENLEWVVDVVRFKQVFLNLIDNAIKFTEHGSVTMGCEIKDKHWVSFYVKDTGIGIPKHELVRVFESFRQVETTIDRIYGGTGLGLAISKNLVIQMGGTIKVESEENVGSKFWFDLPLRLPDNVNRNLIKITENPTELKLTNKKILIIEDEVRNAKLLKFFLEETGAEIFFAFDGKEGINKAKKIPPDLVLLDIKLPNIDGIKVLKVLKQLYPTLPIIAQTAYAMIDDEKKCLDEGCDAYLSKPVKKEELIAIIKKIMN